MSTRLETACLVMGYQGVVNYYGLEGLKKYVAERGRWSPPLR